MMVKHIQGADLREKNRVRLEEVIPLDTPMLMYLEPTNICNITCSFCPTGDRRLIHSVGRKQGIMSWELFHKILHDLTEFPHKIKCINYYKDGEPLVNKHYPEMAAELVQSGVAEKVWFKTNGLLLSPSMNKRIISAGFDMMGISVIGVRPEIYKSVADADIDYPRLVDNVADLFSQRGKMQMYIKMATVNFPQEDIDKFYADFEDKCDFIAIENLHGWSRTELKDFTLGTSPQTFDGVPNTKKIVCPWPLYQLSINWNGMVQPCNEDWSWVNILGNVNQRSVKEIWQSRYVYEFQRMHLTGRRFDNAACGTCWQTMSTVDDVDDYRKQILERLTAAQEARVRGA